MSRQLAQFGDTGLQPTNAPFTFDSSSPTSTVNSFESFISQMIGVLTIVGSVFFIGYFVMGAFKWVTSGGDTGKVQKARDQMVQGVLGLIMLVAAYGIIGLVGTIFGLNILQPGQELLNIVNSRPNTTP